MARVSGASVRRPSLGGGVGVLLLAVLPSTGFAQAAREFAAAPPNPNIGLRLPMLPFGFMVLWKH